MDTIKGNIGIGETGLMVKGRNIIDGNMGIGKTTLMVNAIKEFLAHNPNIPVILHVFSNDCFNVLIEKIGCKRDRIQKCTSFEMREQMTLGKGLVVVFTEPSVYEIEVFKRGEKIEKLKRENSKLKRKLNLYDAVGKLTDQSLIKEEVILK